MCVQIVRNKDDDILAKCEHHMLCSRHHNVTDDLIVEVRKEKNNTQRFSKQHLMRDH